jgi:hypothetical protein
LETPEIVIDEVDEEAAQLSDEDAAHELIKLKSGRWV